MNKFTEEMLDLGAPPDLDESEVCRFLEGTPEFFERHREFLFKLYEFPEPSDPKSLTARQLKIYRQKCSDLEMRLADLLNMGQMNVDIFIRTGKLSLALMDCEALEDLDNLLASELIVGWKLQHAGIFVVDWTSPEPFRHIRSAGSTGRKLRKRLFEKSGPTCETWRAEEYNRLMDEEALDGPGSVAIVPIYRSDVSAALVFGSADPDRFAQQKGTMFLEYLGEVLGRVLDKLL